MVSPPPFTPSPSPSPICQSPHIEEAAEGTTQEPPDSSPDVSSSSGSDESESELEIPSATSHGTGDDEATANSSHSEVQSSEGIEEEEREDTAEEVV